MSSTIRSVRVHASGDVIMERWDELHRLDALSRQESDGVHRHRSLCGDTLRAEHAYDRLGVDVGGTFTDLLLFNVETGAFWRHKTPSTPHDSSEGILNGVTAICASAGMMSAPGSPTVSSRRDPTTSRHR